jgi:hypothetical protein
LTERPSRLYRPSEEAVYAGALAYVQWINPPHSNRQPTETDRNRVRAILVAAMPIELASK